MSDEKKKLCFVRTKISMLIDDLNKISKDKIDINDVIVNLKNKDIIFHIQYYVTLQNKYLEEKVNYLKERSHQNEEGN